MLGGQIRLLISIAVISVVIPAQAQTFSAIDLSGGELFNRYCAACHGESATGDGPAASSLIKQVPDLTRLSLRAGGEFPRAAARALIDGRSPVAAHGTRQMPVWGREFWFEEGADIIAESRARTLIVRLLDHLEGIQVSR